MNSNSFTTPSIIFYPPITKTIRMNQFSVSVSELILFQSVKISVILYDSDTNIPTDNRLYTLQGQDYTNWGGDDKYITDYVKSKLQQESQYQS